MSLTDRDRKILIGLVPLVVVFAYWFMLLAPKREAVSQAQLVLEGEQARLDDAQSRATTVAAAKKNFARDYAAVVRLGKAIPTSVDMPSLLVQLEEAAAGTGIEFQSMSTGERTAITESTSAAATATGLAAPDPAAAAPQSGAGQASASATDAKTAAEGSAQDASQPQPAGDAAAPADGAVAPGASAVPTGAAPAAGGASGLEAIPLEFTFSGDFFELANFFHRLKRFVYVDGEKVRVRGRLMTIDSVSYTADPATFPALTAQVTASVFLTPRAEGATAGATPAGPGAPAAPSPGAPATSTADSGGTATAPTAAATP